MVAKDLHEVPALRRLGERELRVVHALARWERRPRVRLLMLLATRAADGWSLLLVCPLALLVGGSRGVAAIGCGVLSGVVTAGIVHSLKHVIRRVRPLGVDLARPIRAPDLHAFPSGHSAQAFSLLGCAAWVSPALGLLLVPLIVAAPVSRMVFGLHYPSDVLVGAALGGATGLTTLYLAGRWGWIEWLIRNGPLA